MTLTSSKRRRRLIVVGTMLLCVFAFLIYEGLTNSIEYFKTASQAVSSRGVLGTSTFRIEGTVVPGSIRRKANFTYFSISSGSTEVPIVDSGTPPQLFQPGIPVVLVGHFEAGNGPGGTSTTFLSNEIMVKHSSTYIAAHPNRIKAINGTTR